MLSYREAKNGQLLEEGITEAGAMASFTAASTAYSTWGYPLIPFYIFYSMFGFQRVGDQIWAYGDQRGKGFLLGATAGRTTLTGEGLQHCDGQSMHLAMAVPNCRAYDPAFAYEVGVLVRDGMHRMYGDDPEDCFYYLALYNENSVQPPMPDGVEEGIVRGIYRYRAAPEAPTHRAQILASGPMVRYALDAQADARRAARRRGRRMERARVEAASRRGDRRRAVEPPAPGVDAAHARTSRSSSASADGPIVAVTDWVKAVPDSIARFVSASLHRARYRRLRLLRRAHRAASPLRDRRRPHRGRRARRLGRTGDVKSEAVGDAIRRYEIDPDSINPRNA